MYLPHLFFITKGLATPLELANKKLIEAFKQNNDVEGAEQSQLTLDEESEVIDGVIDKPSQLKVLKTELERIHREGERRPNKSLETRVAELVGQTNSCCRRIASYTLYSSYAHSL